MPSLVKTALEVHYPRAKSSPYMKRSWSEDIMALRKFHMYWRNRAMCNAAAGPRGCRAAQHSYAAAEVLPSDYPTHGKLHGKAFLNDSDNV
jgi:hypothetical protein